MRDYAEFLTMVALILLVFTGIGFAVVKHTVPKQEEQSRRQHETLINLKTAVSAASDAASEYEAEHGRRPITERELLEVSTPEQATIMTSVEELPDNWEYHFDVMPDRNGKRVAYAASITPGGSCYRPIVYWAAYPIYGEPVVETFGGSIRTFNDFYDIETSLAPYAWQNPDRFQVGGPWNIAGLAKAPTGQTETYQDPDAEEVLDSTASRYGCSADEWEL